MKTIALAVVLGACGASQSNVTSVAIAPPVHVRVGCIDIAVEATARVPSPTLAYHIANTCEHEATMVLSRLRAVLLYSDGFWQELATERRYQSSHRIDPHATEVAEVAYRGGGLPDDAQICVDLGNADESLAYATHWTCVH